MEPVVRSVLTALNDGGHEAYVVGGAVRDLLMGRTPHDYDVTTSARPEEVRHIAAQQGWHAADIQSERFGIVVIAAGGMAIETASFRGEAYGEDAHRPAAVWYADTLREDVMRRDFTVNALAMDKDGRIYDYVGGQKDLRRKKLVAVGDPKRRFQEDALRLFRACRFTGQLDFMADTSLVRAMPSAFHRVSGLSVERVIGEIDKLMVADAAYKGLDVLVRSGLCSCSCRRRDHGVYEEVPILPECSHLPDTPQSRPFHAFDAWFHTLAVVAHTPPEAAVRYAALFHDIAKGLPGIRGVHNGRYTDYGHDAKGAEMAENILLRWRKPLDFARRVAWLVKTHMKFHYFANTGQGDVDKWLRREALEGPFRRTDELAEAVRQATAVACGDVLGCGRAGADTEGTASFGEYMEMLARQMPVSTKDLHYDPRLPQVCGKRTGECLRTLLKRVQNKELPNEPDELAAAAQKWMKRHEADGEQLI